VKLGEVTDVIAEAWWEYHEHGRKKVSRVAIATPKPDPSGQDWYCPVLIEAYKKEWFPAYGVGAVDALMNAANLASKFWHELGMRIIDMRDTRKKAPSRARGRRSNRART
jgi:hypothetical protein